MADQHPARAADRLYPALLDRLTDEDREATSEPMARRVWNDRRLRAAVLRDLAWLFNTTRLELGSGWSAWPEAERSVLNYGVPSLSGRTASGLDRIDLERGIREAILRFEPRLLPDTLQVRALVETTAIDHHSSVAVEISGHLWGDPIPLEFLIRTQFDLQSGRARIAGAQRPSGAA